MKKLIIAATAAVALVATGCSSRPAPYYDTICVDPITQVRMPDVNCNPGWLYYVPYGTFVPGYYTHITHYDVQYTRRPARGTVHTGGVPASGGTAPKSKSGNVSLKKPSSPKANTPSRPKSGTGGTSKFRSTVRSGRR